MLSIGRECFSTPLKPVSADGTQIEPILGGLPVERLNPPEETHDFLLKAVRFGSARG